MSLEEIRKKYGLDDKGKRRDPLERIQDEYGLTPEGKRPTISQQAEGTWLEGADFGRLPSGLKVGSITPAAGVELDASIGPKDSTFAGAITANKKGVKTVGDVLASPTVDISQLFKPKTTPALVLHNPSILPDISRPISERQEEYNMGKLREASEGLRNSWTIPGIRNEQGKIPYTGAGNIDLNARPTLRNEDGSFSTIDSFSAYDERKGKEVLLPTVIKVGGEWKHVSEDEAWAHYERTGEHLGYFDTPEEANEYAQRLHVEQAKQYGPKLGPTAEGANAIEAKALLRQFEIAKDKSKKAEYEAAKAEKEKSDKYVYGKLNSGQPLTAAEKAEREKVLERFEKAKENYVPGGWLQGAFQQVGGAFANVLPTAVELGNEAKRADVKPLSPVDTGDPEMDAYLAQIGGAADKAVARPEGALLDDEELQSWQQKADELTERGQYRIEMSKVGTSKAEQTLIDIGVGATQLLGDIALGTATGVGVLPVMAIRSFGGGAQEARQNGANVQQQFLYGIASAGVEVITEKIFGGPQLFQKAYGAGFLDNVVNRLTKKLTTKSGQVTWLTAKSFLEEGSEEFIASIVNPFISTIYKEDALKEAYGNGDAFLTTVTNALYDALIGGVLGFAGFAVNAKGEMRNLQQQVAMAELEKMVSIDKLGQELGGEVPVMVKALTESQTYAEGTASRTLGRDLREALYELIDSNDSAGVRNFFKANKAQFDKLLKVMTLESDKIVPAEQDPRRNGTLGELATQSEETQSEDSYSRVMDSTETKVYEALTAKGFSSGEATAVFEYVARIVDGDITLTNNDITERARVGKDPRIIEVINELTGSNLNVNEKSRSKVKAEVRDVIAKVAAAKEDARIAEAQQSAVADVEQMVAETRASVPLEQVFTPAQQASPAAAPAVEPTAAEQSGADKFMAFAKGEAEAEIQPQSESIKSEGNLYTEQEIRDVAEEMGIPEAEATALIKNFGAMAKAKGIDPAKNTEEFIRYSVDEQVENYVNVGNITDEQKLARDILKASLADLGIKDVVLVTGDARMVGSNGSYVGGVVTINADRINTQTYSGIAWTVGHEIVHAAEDADGGRKANGVTVRNAKIVNDIFDVMRVLADAGAIEGRYAEITRDEKSLAALIDKKKNVEHRFLMRDWVDENGVFHKGMTKQQAERSFNDFDARAEIAADFLGSMLGHNFKHEREGRFGSKFGTSDIFAMMEETAPETTSWIHDKLNSIRDRLRGYDAKTAAERKAKATMQRHLTKLSKELAEAISKGAQKNAAQTSDVRNSVWEDSWEQQCDDVMSGKMNSHSAMFITETPNLLAEVGLYDLPMSFTQKHFRAAVNGTNPAHPSKISLATMKRLPQLLSQPVAILSSNTNPMGAILVVTTERDSGNNPIVAAILPEGGAEVDAHRGATNHILTVYGANHLHTPTTNGGVSTLERAAANGDVLYINKKRSQDLYRADGLQLPRALGSLNFDTIIRDWNGYVKKNPPAREAKNIFTGKTIQWSVDDGEYATPMYSKLQREIEAFKGDRIGASSAVSYLRGKGVKAEEIKWSGIETYLEGKKSVNKQELLDWLKANELEIAEETLEDYYASDIIDTETGEVYGDVSEMIDRAYDIAAAQGIDEDDIKVDFDDNHYYVYAYNTDEGEIELVTARIDRMHQDNTRWSGYKIPDGYHYREYLYRMPGIDYGNEAMSVHWNDTSVLAHARVQDFDHDGKPVLFVEEIQSDWHNAGAKQGYASKEKIAKVDELDTLERKNTWHNSLSKEEQDRMAELRNELYPEQDRINEAFDENESKWRNDPTLYGLVEYVATEVFDGNITKARDYLLQDSYNDMDLVDANVEWLTRRYEMDIKPEEHEAVRDYYRTLWRLRVEGHELDTKRRNDKYAAPEAPYAKNYHEFVLKNLLRKAAEGDYDYLAWTPGAMQEERWSSEFAEGYRIEYDQDIPKFLNKYGKQWGAKVERIGLDGVDTGIVDEAYIDSLAERNYEIRRKLRTIQNEEEAAQLMSEARKIQAEVRKARLGTVWAIPITPEMKRSVLYEGQPRFSVDDTYMEAVENGDMETAQRMVDEKLEREGFTVRGNHGTTNFFTVFDREKGNPEGDWGRGFYFTNTESDANANYANTQGPDLVIRIERLAEQLEWMDGYEDLDYGERLEIARGMLSEGEPRTIKAALRMNNPVVMDFSRGTYFDFNDGYNHETEEYDADESGLLIDFVEAVKEELYDNYEWVSPERMGLEEIYEEAYDGGMSASEATKWMKTRLAENDVSNDAGDMAGNDVVRAALERMGFDAVEDREVDYKFGSQRRMGQKMAGMNPDTVHYILFAPQNIKQADAVTYDNRGNVIPLSMRGSDNPDIRYSVDDTLDKTAESEYSTISNSEEAKYGNQESTDNRGRQDLGRADNQPHRDGSGESSESGGRNGRGNLGRIERTVIPEKTRKILDDKGIPNVELEETTDRDAFSVALENAKAANPNGGMVDSQSPEDMQKNGSRTFMRADGNAGVAVERDGNIVGVFKNPEYKERGAVYDLILTAVANEGNHLDCYSTYTPADLRTKYARMGFEPVCYLEFNREYAPDGWNYEAWGEPDVVLWVHNGDTVEQIVERTERYHVPTRGEIHALPKFEDYDEAKAYQAQKVEEMLQSKARTETLSKLFRYSVDDTTGTPVKEAEAPTEPELTPQQIRERDRAEALRRVFTTAREIYGDNFDKMSEDVNTKAGLERLSKVFRPAASQAQAEQRTRDDLRLQRERTREAERRREMRKAFNLEKQDIRKEEREKARIDKMAALAVQEQKLDDKWKARMEAKVDKVKAQAEERLRIKMRKADFIRAYENLAAEIREKKAKAEGKRKAAEERRRGNERISEQRVLSRTTAKEARRVLSQSRNTERPNYTNSEVETLRQLRPDDVSTEQVTTLADKLRNARKRLYRVFVNQAQTIDNFSKLQIDGVRAGSLVNMIFGSASTIETIYQNGLVARDGTRLGNAMKEVFLVRNADGSIDQEKQAILQDYMLFVHNIDRMSFSERALARVEAMEAQHPWLVDIGAKEFAYAAGLNDAETEATGTDERRAIVREYAAALKALNEAKDKPIFADKDGKPVSAETSREIVARYEEEHPWLKEKAEGIYEWWDSFMREWAVGNTLSAEAYDTWKQMYPHYVPTYRMNEGGPEGAIQIGPASASINDLYKAAKGSTKPVKNIEESFSTLVRKIVDTSRKNELLRNIIDTAMLDTEGVFGDFAIFDWDGYYESNPEYGEAMENAAWLNGDSISAVESAHVEAIEELDGGYRITAYGMDGGRYSAWVSKEMYRALVAVTNTSKLLGEGANTLTRIGSKLTTPMKSMITGYNPNFAIRNVMRDIPTAIVNGVSGFAFPKYYARALAQIKGNSEAWQQFQALGGTHFGYYGMSTDWAARMEKKPGLGAKALDKLGTLGESTESITRFAEYLATIDKLGDTYEGRVQGIKNAAEVTVDFSRKGEYGKLANAWIPYWNPAVQGIDKLFRQIFDNSTSVKQKFAVSGVTLTRGAIIAVLPELLQYLLLKAADRYDDWEKLSDRMKDSYFCIPIAGEHKFFKIPKTREWGTLLGTPLMRMLEGFNGRSDPFENYVEDALLANFSVSGVVDAIGISTIIDLRTNKDFAGRDIVPYAYQEASASKQYDADTSAIAYGVATAWNKSFAKIAEALGKEVELSPMQLDYIINDYCGDFYYMLAQMVPVGLFDGSTGLKEIFGGILGSMEGTWVGDNRYSNYYTGEYYDILDYLDRSIADEKLMNPEDYTNSYVFKLDKAFNEAYGKQLSELNKQAAQLPDGEEKDAIKEQIADLAFEAVEWFRNESINNSDDPFLRVSYGDFSNELQDALIDLDSFSGDYYFKPSPSTSKSYTDPHNKGKEYVLTEEQYAQYKTFYMEAYDEIMTRAVKSYQYKRLSDEEKAEYLDEARDAVHEKAKEELFTWLRRNGVKSTYKAD